MLTIENEEQAKAAVGALVAWLNTVPNTKERPSLGWLLTEESKHQVARNLCTELLEGVNAQGLGGCPLCQS